jgi:D-serine deaminase-like pyridoxal phosphate-dependent protein
MRLSDLTTPTLVLDRGILARNCRRMAERTAAHGVALRPHLKTAKSADVARLATDGQAGGITVSTLAEARYFADRGFRDITYAVGFLPSKLDEAAALIRDGVSLRLLVDGRQAVAGIAARAVALDVDVPLLIEVDCGGCRGGVDPEGGDLLDIADAITAAPRLSLSGVLTHAGQSYHCRDVAGVRRVAEQERAAVVRAAARLRGAGYAVPVVSAGSTPTAVHAEDLSGVTEIRPGVYMFNDLDQVGIGSCADGDIALTVLAGVIGHNRRAGRILVDAGALALSKDISAGEFLPATGYGRVADLAGRPHSGLYVADVHQEHGLIAAVDGEPPYDALPIGARVRIVPNHACMTAAAYPAYHVVEGGEHVVDRWDRVNGW